MELDFYTNIYQNKGKFLVRGFKNGKPVRTVVNYKPYVFMKSKTGNTKFRTTSGIPVERMDFDSIYEAKDFLKEYQGVEGFDIYGSKHFLYNYIFDNFRGEIPYDPSLISVVSLDIETKMGKEDIATAIITTPNEVTAITISRNGHKTTFGTKDFDTSEQDNVTYVKCRDEVDLLNRFISLFGSEEYTPDVLTGWNIEFFDIPYLVGRIARILGDAAVTRLSPWGIVRPYELEIKGRKVTSYDIVGINVLDYLALYKKFTYSDQESFKLDHIASVELGEKKVDYTALGYVNLNDLYERNPQLFFEYNVQDVVLIDQIEDKMKLIELVYAMAYDAKVNFIDTMASVKPWEVIISNYLMEQNIVVDVGNKGRGVDVSFAGGYVKDVQVGMHKWVLSLDLTSLYPHLIMQYNISPDTFVTRLSTFPSIDTLLEGQFEHCYDQDVSYTANGCLYSNERQGFLGAIMERMYNDRSKYKKQMLHYEAEYEKTKDKELKKNISKFHNLQLAKKIQLNSCYGALGNKYFAHFDVNHAEAITLSGQLSIRWIANSINAFLNKICKTEGVDYVIASDTDSVYITVDNLVEKYLSTETDKLKIVKWIEKFANGKLQDHIESEYDNLAKYMNAYQQKMIMKLECIADKTIFTAKKRYAMNNWYKEGVFYDKPKLKMVGIEAIKSSTPAACRDAIKESLNIIMNKEESDLHKFIDLFKQKFLTMDFEQIGSPRGVSSVSEYTTKGPELFRTGTPINAKGSILYNHLLKKYELTDNYELVSDGDKIKYCYLKLPNPHRINVIACPGKLPEEFKLKSYLNYDLQFERAFLAPIETLVKAIGWDTEKRATLEDFFG